MTRIHRRQRQLYFFGTLVMAIAVINALFFAILYRPTRSEYFRLQDSIHRLRAETSSRMALVQQKEKIAAQLETSNQDRVSLVKTHFIPLDVGFVQVQPELDKLAQEADVKKSRVDDTKDTAPQFGLYSVKIKIPVSGSYSTIVKFIKMLENSETFYIIRSIDVRSGGENSFQPAAGNISLDLMLETFFYQ